jgi:hypothetical protein
MVGDGGTILIYDGVTVSRAVGAPSGDLNAVWIAPGGDILVVGDGGAILRSTDGSVWSAMASGTGADLYGVWGSDASRVWAVGDQGALLFFDGSDWQAQTAPAGGYRGVWGSGASDIFFVGAGGLIAHYGGAGIAQQASPVATDLHGVFGPGPYAVGSSGIILSYSGGTWVAVSSPTAADITGIGTDGNGGLAAAVADGSVLRLDGGSWKREGTVSDNALGGVTGVAGELFAVGSTGTVIRYGR